MGAGSWWAVSAVAAVIEDAGGSDLEGRRQGKQVLAPREQRWGGCRREGQTFYL